MKKLFILLAIIGLLASCGNSGTNTCLSKLQETHKIVYTINAFDYIVIDSNSVYHYIPDTRGCSNNKYTIIRIN